MLYMHSTWRHVSVPFCQSVDLWDWQPSMYLTKVFSVLFRPVNDAYYKLLSHKNDNTTVYIQAAIYGYKGDEHLTSSSNKHIFAPSHKYARGCAFITSYVVHNIAIVYYHIIFP